MDHACSNVNTIVVFQAAVYAAVGLLSNVKV